MLVAIELPDLATLFHTEEILAAARAWLLVEVEVGHLIGVA